MTDSTPWYSLPEPPASSQKTAQASASVLIIGAGLAGCWLARTLAERGIRSTVVESNTVAAGASGNSVGVVKPYVTRTPCFADYFYEKAFTHLLSRLNDWDLRESCGFDSCGVVQLCQSPYQERHSFRYLSAVEASQCAGAKVNSDAIWFADSGYLNPHSLCQALLDHALIKVILKRHVSTIQPSTDMAKIELDDKRTMQADILILAAGQAIRTFAHTKQLPVIPARGQTSTFRCIDKSRVPRCIISGKHYAIPERDTLTVGATFLRNDVSTEIRQQEHENNLEGLRKLLPEVRIDSVAVHGHAGVRATTPDRLPLVGPVPDHVAAAEVYHDLRHGRPLEIYPDLPTIPRLMLMGGFGSRGIVTTSYCAQLLADYLFGTDPTDCVSHTDSLTSFASLLNPVRFQIRQLRRGQ